MAPPHDRSLRRRAPAGFGEIRRAYMVMPRAVNADTKASIVPRPQPPEPAWLPSTAAMSSRPSRALRPETEVCQIATGKISPNPNWARAGKRIHREVYPGYARWFARRGGTEEDEKHLLLFQVVAILFFDRECAGELPEISRPYSPLQVTQLFFPPENDLIVFGGTTTTTTTAAAAAATAEPFSSKPCADIDTPLPDLPSMCDLRLILEYLLCIDYKLPQRPTLASVNPASLESFARMSKRLYDFVWRCEECRPRDGDDEPSLRRCSSARSSLRYPSAAQVRAADAAAQLVRGAALLLGLNYTDLALMCFHFYRLSWAALPPHADDPPGTAAADLRAHGFGDGTLGDAADAAAAGDMPPLEGEGWNRGDYNSPPKPDAGADDADDDETRSPLVFGRGGGAWGWGFDTYRGFRQSLPHPLIYGRWQGSLPVGVRDRVLRKASVDANDVIPAVVFDRRRACDLTAAARDLAATHGITTLSLVRAHPQPPEPEALISMGLGEAVTAITDSVFGAAISAIGKLGGGGGGGGGQQAAAAAGGVSRDWEVLEEDLPHGRDDDHEADDDVPDGWEMI
ncbi:hypothetical protein RB597_005753 [Gaeumannomyces tritici]